MFKRHKTRLMRSPTKIEERNSRHRRIPDVLMAITSFRPAIFPHTERLEISSPRGIEIQRVQRREIPKRYIPANTPMLPEAINPTIKTNLSILKMNEKTKIPARAGASNPLRTRRVKIFMISPLWYCLFLFLVQKRS
jgi:hypothetical protein